jgi:hypothetical protein
MESHGTATGIISDQFLIISIIYPVVYLILLLWAVLLSEPYFP